MNQSRHIAIASNEVDTLRVLQDALVRMGHSVSCVAESYADLMKHVRAERPDLLIADAVLSERDVTDGTNDLFHDDPVPIVLISDGQDGSDLMGAAASANVFGCLVKPIKQADLEPAIALAMHRFEQLQALRRQTQELQVALETI